MGTVVLDITMSLDGFVATPDHDTERLHAWVFSDAGQTVFGPEVRELMETSWTGAVIAGRRTYDVSGGWGGDPPVPVPYFVISHDVPEGAGERFTFVTDGVRSALEQAQAVAGDGGVYVMGGADIARQFLAAGLLDEIRVHLVPVLLGAGIPLFGGVGPVELEPPRVRCFPRRTELTYRVVGKAS
ncbi:dihydrofolate reductase family protein [Sphaerisporangium siamense]|uniref:Dihydrofolate reductase n=1 Tax=Sphaerisporangium siamense TaxID=795645 RepID=A0A7W7D5R6_9ACTN|nr:dihydrofolate reductase family protein [Sphaerisporangium siamense]MBB4699830.1 dihydrofolate reductase [Sphaerisporangium siamense]